MLGKKGMSPIIATILLIAFAVALGAMIMNWSSSLVAEGALDSTCKATEITVRNPVCFLNNKIKLDVINSGETDVQALMLRIKSSESNQDIQIKNSRMGKGDVLTREVSALKPDEFVIEIIPVVTVSDGLETCDKVLHSTTELPICQ